MIALQAARNERAIVVELSSVTPMIEGALARRAIQHEPWLRDLQVGAIVALFESSPKHGAASHEPHWVIHFSELGRSIDKGHPR